MAFSYDAIEFKSCHRSRKSVFMLSIAAYPKLLSGNGERLLFYLLPSNKVSRVNSTASAVRKCASRLTMDELALRTETIIIWGENEDVTCHLIFHTTALEIVTVFAWRDAGICRKNVVRRRRENRNGSDGHGFSDRAQ